MAYRSDSMTMGEEREVAEEREVVSVKIRKEVHRLVKIAAAERDVTIGQLYENGVLRVLRDMGIKAPKEATA
jgi:hypothetical protein